MYKDDYKEKSNRRMVAIFCVLFFFICYKCSSQSRDYPRPMMFGCGLKDTIYVSIKHDTLTDIHNLTVLCTKHNHTEWKSITFGFVDGDMLEVYQDFGWVIDNPKLLESVEFDFVSFDESFFSTACINVRTKDYFIKYFQLVNK